MVWNREKIKSQKIYLFGDKSQKFATAEKNSYKVITKKQKYIDEI